MEFAHLLRMLPEIMHSPVASGSHPGDICSTTWTSRDRKVPVFGLSGTYVTLATLRYRIWDVFLVPR